MCGVLPEIVEPDLEIELDTITPMKAGSGPAGGEQLMISPKTVGTHIEHIFTKLGVRSRAQAVAVAYREHLVDEVEAHELTT